MNNPISGFEARDGGVIRPRANDIATDEVLMALIRVLARKKVLDTDELVREIDATHQTYRRSGPLKTPDDEDRFGASLALGRVIEAIKAL
jgi:hypothetical protein